MVARTEAGVKRILVVDDEISIAETLAIVFEDEGFACGVAANGKAALESARRERPDLVVLDLMMPVMDGRAMLEAMRADPGLREVPVVVMSAAPALFAELPVRPEAFLQKPFDIDAMVETARAFLGPRNGVPHAAPESAVPHAPAKGGVARAAPKDGAAPTPAKGGAPHAPAKPRSPRRKR